MAPLALSLLAPWRATLRGLRVQPTITIDDLSSRPLHDVPSIVWLQWTLPANATRADMTRYLEAMELLVLLAWADYDVWLEAAEALRAENNYSIARQWTERVLEARAPVRLLGHDVVSTDTNDVRLLCEYLSSHETDADRVSQDYYAVRAMLEEAIGDAEGRPEIPFGLRLVPRRPWKPTTGGALLSLAALTKIQRHLVKATEDKRASRSHLKTLRSRLREVHSLFPRVTSELIELMMKIWTRGVVVVDFPLAVRSMEPNNSGLYVHALRSLLGAGCHGCVRRVSIAHALEPAMTRTLLSALTVSSSAREVTYEFERPDIHAPHATRYGMHWLTYALFSGHATNEIATVSFQCQHLCADHVEAMRELLEADDPLRVLYPDLAGGIQMYRDLRVSTSSVRLEHPGESSTTTVATQELADLRVLSRANGWWRVLLPGWGDGWVEEERALTSRVVFTPTASIRSVASLELSGFSVNNEHTQAVHGLLRLVGRDVGALRLQEPTHAVNAICAESFDACPRLEALILQDSSSARLASISDFFDAGRCKHLKRIVFKVELIAHATLHELGEIFQALADPTHAMAQQLEELEVDVFAMEDDVQAVDLEVLRLALRMFETNRRLERLRLHLPLASPDKNAVARLQHGFAKQHGVLLPVPLAPLGSCEKAAFLSIVWGATYNSSSAIHRLDRPILASIFAFAQERRIRRIDVAMPS